MVTADDDPRPPYVQVADALRHEIASGQLGAGKKLPAIREMASRFAVAPMTIQSALRVLRDDGLIDTTPNRGSFVKHRETAIDVQSGGVGELGPGAMQAEIKRMTLRLADIEKDRSRLDELERRVDRLERSDHG